MTAARSPEEVIQTADVVSLHMLLDKSTHHFINKKRLEMMKPDAVLVNAARGPVIDEVGWDATSCPNAAPLSLFTQSSQHFNNTYVGN